MTAYLQTSDGARHPVADGLVIGRDPRAGVVLDDTKASRRHARLIFEGGVVEVEDLDSSNGTLLNGKPVSRRMLRDGDVLRIGTTELSFHEAAAAPPAARDVAPGEDLFEDAPAAAPPPPAPPPAAAATPPAPPPPAAATPPAPPPAATAPPPGPAPFEPAVEVRKPAAEPPPAVEEVLEFADDDVVRVSRPIASAGTRPEPAKAPAREGGVLQYHKVPDQRSLVAQDLSQMSTPLRLLLTLVALAIAAGIFYLAMHLAR